ncbi:MAG: hypothetical protein JWM61_3261, partial [Micrococcaceae bacterium]|nr:hypothetical protein [Micrococcaceae bacterium]
MLELGGSEDTRDASNEGDSLEYQKSYCLNDDFGKEMTCTLR